MDPPAWVPPVGTFADINGNTLDAAKPAGWPNGDAPAGPFNNWNGGAFARDFGTKGAFVIHGSGHLLPGVTLFAGNHLWDVELRQWVSRNVPSPPIVEGGAFNNHRESTDSATLGHLYPSHTYDGLVYLPAAMAQATFPGNVSGALVKCCWPGDSEAVQDIHVSNLDSSSDPAVRVVENIDLAGGSADGSYPATALDEARGGFWIIAGNGNGPLKFVNTTTWAVTSYAGVGYGSYGNQSLIYVESLDCLIGTGDDGSGGVSHVVTVCPIVAGVPQGFTTVTLSGTPPADGRCGGIWSDTFGGVICYEGDGATEVLRLKPPTSGSLTTGTWTWKRQTLAPHGGATPSRPGINVNNGEQDSGNGSWSRFVELPAYPGNFLWCGSVYDAMQAWHLSADESDWA